MALSDCQTNDYNVWFVRLMPSPETELQISHSWILDLNCMRTKIDELISKIQSRSCKFSKWKLIYTHKLVDNLYGNTNDSLKKTPELTRHSARFTITGVSHCNQFNNNCCYSFFSWNSQAPFSISPQRVQCQVVNTKYRISNDFGFYQTSSQHQANSAECVEVYEAAVNLLLPINWYSKKPAPFLWHLLNASETFTFTTIVSQLRPFVGWTKTLVNE